MFKNLWQKQKRPILFFGFLLLIGILIFNNFASAERDAKSWAIGVVSSVTNLENRIQALVDQSRDLPENQESYDQIIGQIQNLRDSAKSQLVSIDNLGTNQQNAAKQVPLYYRVYLEVVQNNLDGLLDRYQLEKDTLADNQNYANLKILLESDWDSENLDNKKQSTLSSLQAGQKLIDTKRQRALELDDTSRQGKLIRYYNTHSELIQKSTFVLQNATSRPMFFKEEIKNIYGTNMPQPQTNIEAIEQKDVFNVSYEDAKDNLRKAVGTLFGGI